jgi:hypothetical protein
MRQFGSLLGLAEVTMLPAVGSYGHCQGALAKLPASDRHPAAWHRGWAPALSPWHLAPVQPGWLPTTATR